MPQQVTELTPQSYLNRPFPSVPPVDQSVQKSLDDQHPLINEVWKIKGQSNRYDILLEVINFREVLLSREGVLFCVTPDRGAHQSVYDDYLEPVVTLCNRDFFTNGSPLLSLVNQFKSEHWQTFSLTCESPNGSKTKQWAPENKKDIDWNEFKKCFCVVTFVSPGIIEWDTLKPSSRYENLGANPVAHYLVRKLQTSMIESEASASVLTDGVFMLLLDTELANRNSPTQLHALRLAARDLSANFLIAEIVYTESIRSRLCSRKASYPTPLLRSAPNSSAFVPNPESLKNRSAFDIYTMQRSPAAWDRFKDWHKNHKSATRLKIGDSLAIERDALAKEHSLWECRSPSMPLPTDTHALVTDHHRERSKDIDEALAASNPLDVSFVITSIIVPNPEVHSFEQWSQVFVGNLRTANPNNDSGTQVCLKLFDERHFRLPDEPDYNDEPSGLLSDLECAEDLARREASIYSRLSHLQGSMIPHCYGFHKFTLPDGWMAYGMIMEYIAGPTATNAQLGTLSEERQYDFVLRLRHAVRALKFSGVSQQDWHLDQILCLRGPDSLTILPVLIDFAFADQDFGETDYRPQDLYDWNMVAALLTINAGMLASVVIRSWIPAVEHESSLQYLYY